MKIQSILISIFGWAKVRGYLDNSLFKWIFILSYQLYKRFLEDDLLKIAQLKPQIFKHGHVIDVGANIGYTSKILQEMKDTDKKLFSFEPESWNFNILSSYLKKAENVELIQKAVGESSRTTRLAINTVHHADHRVDDNDLDTSVPIEMVSIDDFLAKRNLLKPIAFIKIDVQGYELKVCQGMTETLKANPEAVVFLEIVIEKEKTQDLAPGLFKFFNERNFKSFFLNEGQLIQISEKDITLERFKKGYVDILFSRD